MEGEVRIVIDEEWLKTTEEDIEKWSEAQLRGIVKAMLPEVRRLRETLTQIAHATGSMPLEYGDEAAWFRSQFYSQVGTAARAIDRKDSTEQHT